MEKVLLIGLLSLNFTLLADNSAEVEESDSECTEFWPPDMIPHPHPPFHPKEEDNWA